MPLITPHVSAELLDSPTLGGRRPYLVVLPPSYHVSEERYPVLYLLHGMHGCEWDWLLKGRVHDRASSMMAAREIREYLIVTPSDGLAGAGTFYVDWHDGSGRYASYLAHDLVDHVDAVFRTIPHRRARAVAGLSMGGFGAFYLALRYPERFGAASSHSGALYLAVPPEWERAFGPENTPARRERSLYHLAEAFRPGGPQAALCPRLRFDCGEEDYLLDGNRALHTRLQELGIEHTYVEYPGAHTWDYWARHVPETLRFADAWFGEEQRQPA
ncbi:MAG TPA: alpha/beta hydrolase family protein [Limnochordia bacterium]